MWVSKYVSYTLKILKRSIRMFLFLFFTDLVSEIHLCMILTTMIYWCIVAQEGSRYLWLIWPNIFFCFWSELDYCIFFSFLETIRGDGIAKPWIQLSLLLHFETPTLKLCFWSYCYLKAVQLLYSSAIALYSSDYRHILKVPWLGILKSPCTSGRVQEGGAKIDNSLLLPVVPAPPPPRSQKSASIWRRWKGGGEFRCAAAEEKRWAAMLWPTPRA